MKKTSERKAEEAIWRKNFSDRLTLIMLEQGLSGTELSKLTGIPQSTISAYMRGIRMPAAPAVARIAGALGCSVDHLLDFKDGNNK